MMMASEWRTAKLGELVSFKTGKLDSNAAVPDGDYPFFTCSQDTFRTNTYSFDTECVLLGGNNANGIFPLKYFKGKFDAYQRTYVIKPRDSEQLITKFLYYALRPKLSELRSFSTGAATKFLTLTILNETAIEVPSLDEQHRIAGVLSAYDELIENNQRRIRILEDMARSLYREWFIHFRYPGHESVPLVDSPLGQIPQGWECGRLDEVLVLQRGFDLPKGERENGTVPIIAATGINGFHSVAKVKAPGVVTGRSGSIGTVLYVHEDFWPLNTALWVKEFPKSEPLFAYYLLSSLELKQFNSGAAVPTLNRNDVHSVRVVIPSRELQCRFQLNAGAMLKQAEVLQRQTTNLRRTRDLLLPRLLSGQVTLATAPTPIYDEDEFKRMVEKGTQAWADMPDSAAWVETLRGGKK
jgi:type I restriction enzyme S subunit